MGHIQSGCLHAQLLCTWCSMTSHLEKVCYQKVQGKPCTAHPRGTPIRAAATVEEIPEAAPLSSPAPDTGGISAVTMQAQLQAMHEQIKMLMALVARLEAGKQDF
jgi:hypothetical protein